MADKFMKSITFVEGGDQYYPLPKVTNADDGKVLKVVDGVWGFDGSVVKTLAKIEVTTSPTTVNYTEGDALDLTGLVVTATFDDGSTEDVTSQCTFSPSDGTILATTDTSVNISYTYKGVTRSTSQIIVVALVPYLSFIGNEDFTLKTYNATKNWDGTLEYSTDTSTWNTWNGTEISSVGSNLYLRGTGNTKITGSNSSNFRFVFTGTDTLKIACKGNIENLLDYETVSAGGHPTMGGYCYANMFQDCTALTTAPALPATTLASGCYVSMFYNCRSLTTIPALPATTLANDCYYAMFYRCTLIKLSSYKTGSYTTAYRIPKSGTGATADNALYGMFGSTGGIFTGAPSINTTYYTSNTVV